jgi:hypothetical protein
VEAAFKVFETFGGGQTVGKENRCFAKEIMSMAQADQGAQFVILAIRATENIVKKIVAVAASHSMRMDARGVYSLLMRVANVHRASASPCVAACEVNKHSSLV